MIASFKHKGLRQLFEQGASKLVAKDQQARLLRRLDVLHRAEALTDLRVPGFNFHALRGYAPPRYTIHVNGPWCLMFEWADGEARQLDLEQYH